jgi:hypothetical protein
LVTTTISFGNRSGKCRRFVSTAPKKPLSGVVCSLTDFLGGR